MSAVLADIAAGVLVNVITATGRWIGTSAMGARGGKTARRDADIAGWFDTYALVGADFPELPGISEKDAEAWLRRNDVHAVLHELLATRITDAPEADVERLRGALRRTTEQFAPTWFIGRMSGDGRGAMRVSGPISRAVTRAAKEAADRLLVASEAAELHRVIDEVADRHGIREQRREIDEMVLWLRRREVADRVFDWADGEICELVARFEARDPERWRAARQDAFGARIVAVLNAIDRHLTALDDRPDPEADTKWVELYRRQATRAYGTIEPPDFARRRTVPIADLYVPPDIVEPGAARDADGNPITIGFGELAGRIDRTVLLGDPGGGKSTASRVLVHGWAQALPVVLPREEEVRCPYCGALRVGRFCEECGAEQPPATGEEPRPSGRSRVPFLVVLREFAGDDGPCGSVVEHIEERLNRFHQCPSPPGAVERLLLSGGAVVIFDGLDELIDTGRRVEITRIVEQFCERFPLASVLVTSRLVGYDEARLDDTQFDAYRIAGFSRAETAAYVRNWFALEDDTDADSVADAFMRESEQVTDLRSNPLMLALMCILYRGEGTLPRNRPGVYAECAKLLYDKWDTRRGIHVDLQARNLIEPALRHIAYWLFTRDGSPEVTEAELVARVADLLHERGFEQRHDAEAAAGEFVRFCRGRAWILGDAGTTARGEPMYTFTHRTFLEYFAAAYLASVTDTPEELAQTLEPYVIVGEWDVVGQLAIQIKDGATDRGAERVLRTLLAEVDDASDDGAKTNLVAFSARCLDVAEVPPALVREITNRAFDLLESDSPGALSYLPLRHERVRPPAAEVIFQRVAALVDSRDQSDRKLGLRFAAYATFVGAYSMGNWHRLEQHLTARHRDSLIAAAKTDDAIWMRLVDRGTITLADALRLRGHEIGMLFRDIPTAFAVQPWWQSYMEQAAREIADLSREGLFHGGLEADPDADVGRLEAFGAALATLPDPPWPVRADDLLTYRSPFDTATFPYAPEPGTDAFLGAVILLILDTELRLVSQKPAGPDSSSGEAQTNLDRFLNFAGTSPADLDVPGRYGDLIRRWHRGEIRFLQLTHDEPE